MDFWMKVIILAGMMAGVFTATAIPASATMCYQESSNISTSCGGLVGGNPALDCHIYSGGWEAGHPCDSIWDEDWSTYGQAGAGGNVWVFIGYKKPAGVNRVGTIWQVKDADGTANLTIPLGDWNLNSTYLTLVSQLRNSADHDTLWNVNGGSTVLRQIYGSWAAYEEGMWWNITLTPNVTIVLPANTTYATTSIPLNVTANTTISTWQYSLNGAANVTFTPNTTITASMGSNTVVVWANNSDGFWDYDSVTFSVSINITLTSAINPSTLYKTTPANISIYYNESGNRPANLTLNVSVNSTLVINNTYVNVASGSTVYINLSTGNFSKHDWIVVNASIITNISETASTSSTSEVKNSVPSTPSITFFPGSGIIGDTENATGLSTDADADTLSYWFKWGYPNGTNISAGWNSSANFSITAPYENETLRVYVMPSDGEANGTLNYASFTVTHMAITLPVNGVEYIGSTFPFAFNFTAQATQNCTETIGPYIGNTTTYALGFISSSQNHSRYAWYSNASFYNVTCFSSQDASRVYYKKVDFSNIFANWSVSIYTENDWDVPLTISGANLSIFVNCQGGSQYVYTFTGTTITDVKPLCDVQSITAKVDYPSDSYTRERSVPSCTSCDIRMYMVDALVYTVLQIPIYMSDYNYFDSKVELYKLSGGNHYTIAEGFFDVEHKYVTYLTKDNTYYIRITKGTETRDIGYLYAASATAQYLSLSAIRLVPSILLISDNLQMAAAFDNDSAPLSVLRIQYNDLINMTQTVRVQIFNDTSNSPWYDNTFTGISNLSIALNNINTSVRYSVHWTVHHAVLGNSPIEFTAGVGAFGRAVDLGLPAGMAWIYGAVGFVIMLFTMFIIVPETRLVGYLLMLVELGIFTYFTWFHFPLATMALFITFLAAGILYEMKYKGTS